ncbi:hypothetical protein SRB17_50410 [Streptomyces sp. RB17]|nr:hypothetical protein [Streptomyces sp. RB17]
MPERGPPALGRAAGDSGPHVFRPAGRRAGRHREGAPVRQPPTTAAAADASGPAHSRSRHHRRPACPPQRHRPGPLAPRAFERVLLDERGAVDTAAFRRYRLPQYAAVPGTEVHFMETADTIGPLGANSMSESPFSPLAPAVANALRDATGVRFTELPLLRDRV